MLFICYTVALVIKKADLPHIRSLNHFIIGLSAGKANQPMLTDKCCFKTDEVLQNVILLQHDQISVADIACTAQRHKMFALRTASRIHCPHLAQQQIGLLLSRKRSLYNLFEVLWDSEE